MKLTYYNNKSDRRWLSKDLETLSKEGHANPVDVKMLESSSIVKPVFKMKDVDLYATANYCWVDTLHRYYFIDDIILSEGYAYLHCSIDTLMTYREQLHDIKVLVDRNQWDYNLYQVDDKLSLYNFTSQKRVEFPDGFNKNIQAFVLGVIGNTN